LILTNIEKKMKRNKTMNTTFKLKVLISSEAFKNSTPKFPVKKKGTGTTGQQPG
jgi:hypothetical protein